MQVHDSVTINIDLNDLQGGVVWSLVVLSLFWVSNNLEISDERTLLQRWCGAIVNSSNSFLEMGCVEEENVSSHSSRSRTRKLQKVICIDSRYCISAWSAYYTENKYNVNVFCIGVNPKGEKEKHKKESSTDTACLCCFPVGTFQLSRLRGWVWFGGVLWFRITGPRDLSNWNCHWWSIKGETHTR